MLCLKERTNLPVEIWHNCWRNLQTPGLLALTQTCRLFRDICRPLLFRYLFYLPTAELLDEQITDEEYTKWEKNVVRFEGRMKWLVSDPNFATYPRFCMFSGIPEADLGHLESQHPNADLIYHSMLSVFKSSIGSFTSLRVIRLEDIDVDEEILQALHKLPLLKDIRFQSADFSCRNTSPLISVEELSIMEWEPQTQFTPHPLELFSNKRLKAIDIQSYQYASPCLQHLTSQGTSETLTTLRITLDVSIIAVLFAFFETCPQLATLSATSRLSDFHPSYPELSSSALPNLRFYNGVASLAAVIVPGRPVKNITIQDTWRSSINEERPSSTLRQLVKSSVVIDHLSLPPLVPHPDVFHVVSKTFPKLRALELRFTMVDTDAIEITDDDSTPDDEYFDLATTTEVTPIPVDENGCPIKPPTSMKGILDWLCLNKLPLPVSVTELAIMQQNRRLRGINQMFRTCLSFREQYRILEMLSLHFPRLTIVTFGRRHIRWVVGDDGKWKPGSDYTFYITHRSTIHARPADAPVV